MPVGSSGLVARRRAVHDGAKRSPASASQGLLGYDSTGPAYHNPHTSLMRAACSRGPSPWHKPRDLSPPYCGLRMLGTASPTVADGEGGFVPPMRHPCMHSIMDKPLSSCHDACGEACAAMPPFGVLTSG